MPLPRIQRARWRRPGGVDLALQNHDTQPSVTISLSGLGAPILSRLFVAKDI